MGSTPLGHRDVGTMIDRVVGNKPPPAHIKQDIVERTDGIPLLVEEMTNELLEAGVSSKLLLVKFRHPATVFRRDRLFTGTYKIRPLLRWYRLATTLPVEGKVFELARGCEERCCLEVVTARRCVGRDAAANGGQNGDPRTQRDRAWVANERGDRTQHCRKSSHHYLNPPKS